MQQTISKFNQHQVLYVNILFTFFSALLPIAPGLKLAWITMWILVPILLSTHRSIQCIFYMSLYMRVQYSIKLFAILICISILIILIKQILYLNQNKLLNNHFKVFLYYLILLVFPLFYSIFVNKLLDINFIYYLNMINLLFLFYLLKNQLNNIILSYCYGTITSSVLSILLYYSGLHHFPFQADLSAGVIRFCAFMPLCNTLGASCVILVASIYVLLVNKKIPFCRALLLISILSIIGLATFSKTFFVTFAILLVVIFISQLKISPNKKKFCKICLTMLLILSPVILYYGISMWNRFFADSGYTNIIDQITTGRLDKWKIYILPWCKHFYSTLLGLGLGFNYHTDYSSHSLYIGYLSKIGIVGLIALVGFICLIISKTRPTLKLSYIPIIIAILICLAEDMSYNTFNFIPFIVAMITISYKSTSNQ